MKHEEYARRVLEFTEEMRAVTRAKNADYSAGSDDAMNNYYELAGFSGVTPMQCWMCLIGKHWTAIMKYVKTGCVASESIHGRMVDLANYAILGDSLIDDIKEKGLTFKVDGGVDRLCKLCHGKKTMIARHVRGGTTMIVCPSCTDSVNEVCDEVKYAACPMMEEVDLAVLRKVVDDLGVRRDSGLLPASQCSDDDQIVDPTRLPQEDYGGMP